MLVYLSKKIAIPHNTALRSLSWCAAKGWIACGGENGLLKVLKLEHQQGGDPKLCGLAAPSNLTMNQGLEAHHGSVEVVKWNEQHHKLTSSDQQGLIVVWMMYKGQWCEEMINNRNRSVVKDMDWSKDGQKICIVYEDGAVIVGSVGGDRMWGKDIKGTQLARVQWSPNAKRLLFGTGRGDIMIHDSQGNLLGNVPIHCLGDVTGAVLLVGLDWYNGINGYVQAGCACLAVGFDNGRLQLMKNDLDNDPVKIDTEMQVCCMSWNPNGSILAVGGSQQSSAQDKEFNAVQFYSHLGEHLHTLRVPGRKLTAFAWESNSLRMALAVDSYIYFANVRHNYKWGYFGNTVVYHFNKQDKDCSSLVFWNTSSGEKVVKSLKNLLLVTTCEDFCLLAVKSDTAETECVLLLCNALGTPVASKHIPFEPIAASLSISCVVLVGPSVVYVWQYRSVAQLNRRPVVHRIDQQGREGKQWAFHADEAPASYSEGMEVLGSSQATWDTVCTANVSSKYVVVGRVSGTLQFYSIPTISYITKFVIGCRPQKLVFNCDSSRIAVLDVNGVLSIFDVSLTEKVNLEKLGADRKDVWDLKWAEDDPELLAIMEKTRMYVVRGTEAEDPVQSSGYLCSFKDLQVKSLLVDEVMLDPENPRQSFLIKFESKAFRDTTEMLQKLQLDETCQFVEAKGHTQLWKPVCEAALNQLNFTAAERAFVKCSNYNGVQLVKKLQKMDSEAKQRAEIATFLNKFDDAERIYLDIDRRDLAVDLRMKLGDWFRVVQLLKTGGGAGDDTLLSSAWNSIGDYYFESQKYQNAITYYSQGQNNQRLLDCLYILEDFDKMQKLSESLPECHPLLESVGDKFTSFGLCLEAASAYVRAGMVDKAVQVCITLNNWDKALELAEKNNLPDAPAKLNEYVSSLLAKNRLFNAIAVFRKAGKYLEAAKLVFKIPSMLPKDSITPLQMKKVFVSGGLLVEKHTASLMAAHGKSDVKGSLVSNQLHQMVLVDSLTASDTALIDGAWRGAEAYHFYMLAQQQWYSGQTEACLRTALMLRDYEDFISSKEIYSLIALASATCHSIDWCSKAFIKLEALDSVSEQERQKFEDLALEIFTQNPPNKDGRLESLDCFACGSAVNEWETLCRSCGAKFPVCIASGAPLLGHQVWVCSTCKHRASERAGISFASCPLCHSLIDVM